MSVHVSVSVLKRPGYSNGVVLAIRIKEKERTLLLLSNFSFPPCFPADPNNPIHCENPKHDR